ncbi:Uncharacterized protein APZ42_009953, partial [Daphnia magna]
AVRWIIFPKAHEQFTACSVSELQIRTRPQITKWDQRKKKLIDLRKNVNLETVCMLIIDEISYISSKFLGRIEKRLREIIAEKNLPFRGLAVLIVGDMFQFPPVDGTTLYTSTADLYLRNRKLDPATTAGVQYF